MDILLLEKKKVKKELRIYKDMYRWKNNKD